MSTGAFTFVLHSHLPYCRWAGRWPHGEEWLHEGAVDTYLPLLAALHDLAAEGVRYRLTIGLTPVLTEQLADADVRRNLEEYLIDLRDRAYSDVGRSERDGEPTRAALADFYHRRFVWLLDQYTNRFGRDLVRAFRELQDAGFVEIASSAATHGYLPLFERDSSIYAQIATGVRAYQRHFGRPVESFWLPECGYRPPYVTGPGGYRKPGLHEFLAGQNVVCFFVETHAIEGGEPLGKAAGDALGPYGSIPRRYSVPRPAYPEPTMRTTLLPYWVFDTRVAALGREKRTGLQVWSAEHGYPGDYHYLEFHKKDGVSGLRYWAVTGRNVDLADKAWYRPDAAAKRVRAHADHFSNLVQDILRSFHAETGRKGIVVAAYDTELFGHWWFEGIDWLKEVLRRLAASADVDLTGAAEFVRAEPPEDVLALPESSWGQAGNHFTWMNADTAWMWPIITAAQERMERLVAKYPSPSPAVREALDQAARELLLLESSDWPFLVTTWQAREYATLRFSEHVERFNQLAGQLEQGGVDAELVARYRELDNVFPDIDYRDFEAREGIAAPPVKDRR